MFVKRRGTYLSKGGEYICLKGICKERGIYLPKEGDIFVKRRVIYLSNGG